MSLTKPNGTVDESPWDMIVLVERIEQKESIEEEQSILVKERP
jgi:hypothetical protein